MSGFGLEIVEYVSPGDALAVRGRRMRLANRSPARRQGLHVGIVSGGRFNEDIVRELLTACDKQLVELGVAAADIDVVSVPGALEIPLALQAMALERRGFASRRYDALVALWRRGARRDTIISRWSPTRARAASSTCSSRRACPSRTAC